MATSDINVAWLGELRPLVHNVYREKLSPGRYSVVVVFVEGRESVSYCIQKDGCGHKCWVLLKAEPHGYGTLQEATQEAVKAALLQKRTA